MSVECSNEMNEANFRNAKPSMQKRKLVTNSNFCQNCGSTLGKCHVHDLDIYDPVPSVISSKIIASLNPKRPKTSDQQKRQKEQKKNANLLSRFQKFVGDHFTFNFHFQTSNPICSKDFPEDQKIERPKWFFSRNMWTNDKKKALDEIFSL